MEVTSMFEHQSSTNSLDQDDFLRGNTTSYQQDLLSMPDGQVKVDGLQKPRRSIPYWFHAHVHLACLPMSHATLVAHVFLSVSSSVLVNIAINLQVMNLAPMSLIQGLLAVTFPD
jgi:hypothetical protein